MAKNIKNIKVSYPDEYNDSLWLELYAKRDKMLRMSDWVLLDDANLTSQSLKLWKTWRNSLKLLTRDKFPLLRKAKEMLKTIKSVTPIVEYNDVIVEQEYMSAEDKQQIQALRDTVEQLESDVSNMAGALMKINNEKNSETISRQREHDMVNDIIREYKLAKPEVTTQALPSNLSQSKDILYDEAKELYFDSFSALTAVPMPVMIERCEQAIDYKVTGDLDSVPLVKNFSKLTTVEPSVVSDMFINDKKELMTLISELDVKRWNLEQSIMNADTVEELENIKKTINLE